MTTISANRTPDAIARAEAAGVDAARHANAHAGIAARYALDGYDLLAWRHRAHAAWWRTVARSHAARAQRARLERTVAWCAGETLS